MPETQKGEGLPLMTRPAVQHVKRLLSFFSKVQVSTLMIVSVMTECALRELFI